MNTRAVEHTVIPEFIFGDQQLHARFSIAIELLARIVIANPRAATTSELADAVRQTPRTVRALLIDLHQSGLLCRDDQTRDAWFCAAHLETITLADIFRSVASNDTRRKKPDANAPEEARSAAQQGVDLLLMQATMAINQVVLQHLQAFDLGRLKAVRSGGAYSFPAATRSYIAEPV